jgi:hypothetical protein
MFLNLVKWFGREPADYVAARLRLKQFRNAKRNAQLVAQRLREVWAAEARPVQFKKAA